MTGAITVHLIDDDKAVLDSLADYLESTGHSVHRYARAAPFVLGLPMAATPACIVSDVRMPGMSGLELQQELKRQGSTMPLILITGHGDIDMAVAAIKAGAYDFLEKPFDERRLAAVIAVAVADAARQHDAAREINELKARLAELSERQRQVMSLAVQGRTNKEIGATLGISPRTVEIYRAKVMERMGANTLADLVRIAIGLNDRQ